jgi:peptidoglycan/LPS O-acetylase OafA/YrhL
MDGLSSRRGDAPGVRLEVDDRTERQQRNKPWLAEHPLVVALVGAALLSGMFGFLGRSGDSSSGLGVDLALGLLAGGALGWGFSVENREVVPRGIRVAAYSACAFGLVAFAVVKTV